MRVHCKREPVTVAAVLLALAAVAVAQPIPESPGDLVFPALTFEPPRPEAAHIALPHGVPGFVVTDNALPVVDIALHFRFGSFDDPAGREGLAALAIELVRMGGTESLGPDELAETLEALAIDTRASAGTQSSVLSISCLTEDLDRALAILGEIVKRPRLDADRLEVLRQQTLQAMAHRLDAPAQVAAIYTNQVLYAGHLAARMTTGESISGITRDDVAAFVAEHVHPGSLVVAAAGDIVPATAEERFAELLADWEPRAAPDREVPSDPRGLPPGVYIVDMQAAQASVSFAHHSLDRHDPDYDPNFYALRLANVALGGGFGSRLVQALRVQRGLTYDIGISAFSNVGYPGLLGGDTSVALPSAAYAAGLIRDVIREFCETGPSEQELAVAKQSLFGTWVGFFESATSIANSYASLLIDEMPLDFYLTWYAKSEAADTELVARVARELIRPSDFRWIVVGPADRLLERDEEHGVSLSDLGPVRLLQRGDPMMAIELEP